MVMMLHLTTTSLGMTGPKKKLGHRIKGYCSVKSCPNWCPSGWNDSNICQHSWSPSGNSWEYCCALGRPNGPSGSACKKIDLSGTVVQWIKRQLSCNLIISIGAAIGRSLWLDRLQLTWNGPAPVRIDCAAYPKTATMARRPFFSSLVFNSFISDSVLPKLNRLKNWPPARHVHKSRHVTIGFCSPLCPDT